MLERGIVSLWADLGLAVIVVGVIRQIVQRRNLTLLLIEHDMSVVMGISDRVAVLHFGEKIAEGPPETVRNDPGVINAYLGGGDD